MKPTKKLTPAQKRIAIAKDVLAQIELKKFKIQESRYWNFLKVKLKGFQMVDQKILLAQNPVCKVCGAAAAIISGIRLFNQAGIYSENVGDENKVINASRWFSITHLAMIEAAFEVSTHRHVLAFEATLSTAKHTAAIDFNEGINDPVERVQRIYKNIIKNKGTFKP